MAGFEVIVRPAVFPNIRPAVARRLPPEDDPTKGMCVIAGSGGGALTIPHSWSSSVSHSGGHKETVRQFDEERVYQTDEDGNVNRDNYVDVERMTKVRMVQFLQLTNRATYEDAMKMVFNDPPERSNVEVLRKDVTRKSDE